ncbi:hypothetical protein [Streptomyces sp. NPDC005760]|uniref:hypothetical protein n=1 Tax=Streptomyces sp. NPDC005760 TaxID=3156718 RepID=UPI003411452B
MPSARPGPLTMVRLLLRLQMQFSGNRLPGHPWALADARLFICDAAGCRWARFLLYPTPRDFCPRHGLTRRYPAKHGDRDWDVKCPEPECVVERHIDVYDETIHHAGFFRCAHH